VQATGKLFLGSLVMEFFLLTIFHAILDTVKRHLQNRTVRSPPPFSLNERVVCVRACD
jgi:hypothetical protein